jgi:hypothetical protein
MKQLFTLLFMLMIGRAASAQTTDQNNTLSADRPIIGCPIQQPTVKNGAKPDPALLKKLIQCSKGEQAASKGYDGAVTVEVASVQVGTPRRWSNQLDMGSGATAQTIVYPVKAVYTVKTFYRTRTWYSENWVRVMNFYVNAFGEWASGSEEGVKMGVSREVPR